MAGSLNKMLIIGNLGKDPDVRRTQDGRPIVNLTVATSDDWKDKTTGERKTRVEWHRVVIFNEGLCRVAEQYLKKGAKVYLEGSLQTRKWTDQQGVERYSTEVVLQGFNSVLTMLDGPGGGQGQASGGQQGAGGYGGGSVNDTGQNKAAGTSGGGFGGASGGGHFDKDLDDEIPF